MNNETFIFILRAKFKEYYLDGKSVGMEVKELVEDFNNEEL